MAAAPAQRYDVGLLILRIGIGLMFVGHGLPKLLGGPARWRAIGEAMSAFGIEAWPELWGVLAAVAEGLGGLCFAAGILFRPACIALLATMIVAAGMHLDRGDSFTTTSHAIEAGILFFACLWLGPGQLRLGRRGGGR
jgi:putative oxidoreductase